MIDFICEIVRYMCNCTLQYFFIAVNLNAFNEDRALYIKQHRVLGINPGQKGIIRL